MSWLIHQWTFIDLKYTAKSDSRMLKNTWMDSSVKDSSVSNISLDWSASQHFGGNSFGGNNFGRKNGTFLCVNALLEISFTPSPSNWKYLKVFKSKFTLNNISKLFQHPCHSKLFESKNFKSQEVLIEFVSTSVYTPSAHMRSVVTMS